MDRATSSRKLPEAFAIACMLAPLVRMRPARRRAPVERALGKNVWLDEYCLRSESSIQQTGSIRTGFRPGSPFGVWKTCRLLGISILVLCGALLPVEALAAQVTLEWDYQDPRAAGFMLYCGSTSGSYDTRLDVGNTTSAVVSGLTIGATYYCAVTAYDYTEESRFSNEITVIPFAAPSPDFSISTTSGMAPLSVALTNTTSGQASRWQWDFGDGTGSTLQNPTHVYTAPGRYTVKVSKKNYLPATVQTDWVTLVGAPELKSERMTSASLPECGSLARM